MRSLREMKKVQLPLPQFVNFPGLLFHFRLFTVPHSDKELKSVSRERAAIRIFYVRKTKKKIKNSDNHKTKRKFSCPKFV